MRAFIVLLAIFACASARLNGAQVYSGFSTKLGFTQEINKELQTCGAEIATAARTYLAPGKAALQAKLLGLLFASDAQHREALTAVAQYAATALPACRQFAHSFVTLVASKATVSADEKYIRNLLKYRLQKYSAEIISELARLPEAHHQGNDAKVGETIAYIIQIVSGVAHPEGIIEYATNYKQPIEVSVIETDRFILQTLNNAAKELGVQGQVSEERAKQLRVAFQGLFTIYVNTYIQLHQTRSIVEREVVVLAAIRDLVTAAAVVRENVLLTVQSFSVNVTATQLHQFKSQVLGNYLRNLPTIQKRGLDLGFAIRAHHPASAGKAIAEIVKAYITRQ